MIDATAGSPETSQRAGSGAAGAGGTGVDAFAKHNKIFIVTTILVAFGCGSGRGDRSTGDPGTVGTSQEALNPAPRVTDFALYAANSINHQAFQTLGGDIGVQAAASGATLVPGFELVLGSPTSATHTDGFRTVSAPRIQLNFLSTIGDAQGAVTNLGGTLLRTANFPVSMPPLPLAAPVSAGQSDLTVTLLQTISPGNYRNVVLAPAAVLTLNAGTYQFGSLTLGIGAHVLTAGNPGVDIRISGRLSTSSGSSIEPLLLQSAKNLRVEVSGINGSTGAPTESPPAAAVGDSSKIRGLVLVPNGTLDVGAGASLTGAFAGRDINLRPLSNVLFQDGFATCSGSCDDGNPCTTDGCGTGGTCVHVPVADGTTCADDGQVCTTDLCGGGICRHAPGNAGAPCGSERFACDGTSTTCASACTATAQCRSGLTCNVGTGRCVAQQELHGYVLPAIATAPLVGPVPPSTPIHLTIGLPIRDPQGLDTFVQQVSDPTNPLYGHYLTPSQFAGTYGPLDSDYTAVQSFAQAKGLTVTTTYPNRTLVEVDGTADAVNQAFNTTLNYYLRSDGSQFYAAAEEPSVDLATALLHVDGLDDFSQEGPLVGTGPNGSYFGNDFRKAYVPCTTLTGAGQRIGLFERDGFSAQDLTTYATNAGMAPINASTVLVSGFSGTPSGKNGSVEVAVDIEVAAAMAPGATIVVFEGPGANANDAILNTMATTEPLAYVLSSSWIIGMTANTPQILKQMAAQGQSLFQGSGDSGSYSNLTDMRGADNVTVVGGTILNTDASQNYQSETGWPSSGGGILSGPGTPIPSYQQGIDMSTNGGSTTIRNLPDVSFVAQNIEVVATSPNPGTVSIGSGTSVSSPLWAAFVAMANQKRAANGSSTIGFANPLLYGIAKNPVRYAAAFFDITSGGNGGFNAVAGYDLVTGLGSPRCAFLNELGGLSVDVRVTETQIGPEICGAGQGFTPGGTVSIRYLNVPVLGTVFYGAAQPTADAQGDVSFFDDSPAINNLLFQCSASDVAQDVIVEVTDDATGAKTQGTFPPQYFCLNAVVGTNFNGGCP